MKDLNNCNRRNFLMNIAKAGLLLPFASQLLGQRAFAAGNSAKNVLFLCKSNGFVQNHWNPMQGTSAIANANELSFSLAPLTAWHNNMIVLKNIVVSTNPNGTGDGGGHKNASRGCLTGDSNMGGEGASIDYLIAKKLHQLNSNASADVLNLGVRTGAQSMMMVSKPFGTGAEERTIPENNPRAAMTKLLGKMNVVPLTDLQKRTYAAVLSDFDDLSSAMLSAERASKVDEHKNALTILRDRINVGGGGFTFNPNTEEDLTGNKQGSDQDKTRYPFLCRAQIDNVVGAFVNNLHNVATIQLAVGDEANFMDYRFDECFQMNALATNQLQMPAVPLNSNMHQNHTSSHEDKVCTTQGQQRWYNKLLDYTLQQLQAQGILNETLVVMFSEEGDHQHNNANGSIIVAGGAGSGLSMGRVIDCNHNRNTLELFGDVARLVGASGIGGPWRSGLI